nr:PREDICTED: WD repeat-containing protein 13-like [Bemisia tabaci]XP_018913977.1 PREDICTED: WD repeat-containing protein 13-like [Bemisia tabaci]
MWQQQAFVIDAKFNAHRAQNHPNFRTLYIRRRNQLLRDYSRPDENGLRSQYLKLRTQLLQQRYNVDSISTSRSISARSSSRVSYVSINSNFSFLFIFGCISTTIEN